MKFYGTVDQLKNRLAFLGGKWHSPEHKAKHILRTPDGGVLTWFETTNSLMFQGREEVKEALESAVKEALTLSRPDTSPDGYCESGFAAGSDAPPVQQPVDVLFTMKLGDVLTLYLPTKERVSVLRVPGGWIYTNYADNGSTGGYNLSSCFVPFAPEETP